ncbi:MAG: hypothetical protein HY255_05020 [Betaproteobacteria bacterium]|nr:hypothetical protein [Betaproteobacteria bacterium]
MNLKAVFGAAIVASLIVFSAMAQTNVTGWFLAGSRPKDYEMGVIRDGGQNGGPAGFLQSKADVPSGFGTMMQTFSAHDYLGMRVRLSATVRSEGVKNWAGLWMRVDGSNKQVLALDNMRSRPIQGTTAWQRYEIVLDVPTEATYIALGVLVEGNGKVSLDEVKFAVVPSSIPVTSTAQLANRGPKNLGFDQP